MTSTTRSGSAGEILLSGAPDACAKGLAALAALGFPTGPAEAGQADAGQADADAPDLLVRAQGELLAGATVFAPWGQGRRDYLWAIFDDAPAGVSLFRAGVLAARRIVPLPQEGSLSAARGALTTALATLLGDVLAGAEETSEADRPEAGAQRPREATARLWSMLPQGLDTPLKFLADLGREYRDNPRAFILRHGLDPFGHDQEVTGGGHPAPLGAARIRPEPGAATASAHVGVRPAAPGDALLNWLWVNDPTTRRMFKQNGYIGWDGHRRWFARLLERQDMRLFIGLADGRPMGNVRFDRQGPGVWEISLNADPRFRGLGLAPRMLAAAMDALAAQGGVDLFFAMAKRDNPASWKTFARVGVAVCEPRERLPGMEAFDPSIEVYMERRLSVE